MNILIHKSETKPYQNKITSYNNRNFVKEIEGGNITYKYLDAALEAYTTVRAMQEEGIVFTGFVAYLRLTKADYETNQVPVGITNSETLDGLGIGTGVQKVWNVWQPTPIMTRNDDIEVIINAGLGCGK